MPVRVLQGKKFSCGDEVTSADFHLWEMLDQHEYLVRVWMGFWWYHRLLNLCEWMS